VHEPPPIDLAVRVYPEIAGTERTPKFKKHCPRPRAMLVFDTETRTDATQRLTFGCFRFIVDGRCLREALFHAPDLTNAELVVLSKYAASHSATTQDGGRKVLDLLTVDEFLNELYRAGYKGRCLIVGFNLPFDLSRIAFDVAPTRGKFAGGFSLGIWSYVDQNGRRKRNSFRPRIAIKHIDSKRSLIGFTAQRDPDAIDLKSEDGSKEPVIFRGNFLDLRTLAFALTNGSFSLKSACKAFGVKRGKLEASGHGKITAEYIDYCRRDVEATEELAQKLLTEFDRHPIHLQETKAFSPASIGKAYLREMGITPVLERQASLQPFIGYAQSAFVGGRTSAHIRGIPIPVVYTDFLSMYPTVNSLMNLWKFVIAKELRVRLGCIDKVISLLEKISLETMFKPDTWSKLTGFVRIVPNGDILPARAKYNPDTNDWQVGINYLYANKADDALWYSLPDVAASVLLTGKIPRIVDAFMLEAHGTLPNLRSTKLRGAVEVDPRTQDFFKVVIEDRKRLSQKPDISMAEAEQLGAFLKVLANAASYGIYAEMNRSETKDRVPAQCHGIDEKPFFTRVANPEIPGEFCSPPIASLITGGARLMLALLEKCVTELGGSYAMEDTDSMAIVATEHGGLVECPGGRFRTPKGAEAIMALSRQQVKEISDRFTLLNPYDPGAVPGPVLKIEDDNLDLNSKKQRQLWCYAISAKRYVLFLKDENGIPELLRNGINNAQDRWSEHGLGHLLNPTDTASDDRDWIAQVWDGIVCSALGKKKRRDLFEQTPAVGRITVSSPAILHALREINEGKEYAQQIKPFNFLVSCQVRKLGHPPGVDPAHFHLIAPYETDPKEWPQMKWIDQHSGGLYQISISGHYSSRRTARAKTFGEVISEYAYHAEPKCADSKGNVCGKNTVGLLHRRHVQIDRIRFIGKESNLLEAVDSCLIHSSQDAYIEYIDPSRDEWETKIRPALKALSLSALCKETGLSRRMLINARTGNARPHLQNQRLLAKTLRRLTLI